MNSTQRSIDTSYLAELQSPIIDITLLDQGSERKIIENDAECKSNGSEPYNTFMGSNT